MNLKQKGKFMIKLSNINRVIISCTSASVLIFGCLGVAMASGGGTGNPSFTIGDYTASSKGVIEIDEHAIFDARDITTIYNEVSDGKTNIASAITNNGGTLPSIGSGEVYTFAQLIGQEGSDASTAHANGSVATGSSGIYSVYDAGISDTWEKIQNAADGSTLSTDFASVNGVDSLVTAVNESNISYYTEGYTSGLAQASANAASNIPSGYNFNISISLPLNSNTASTWIQNDETTTQTATSLTTIDVSSGVFNSIKVYPSFTTQSGGPHHSESTSVVVTGVKDGGSYTLSDKGGYTYSITGYTSINVRLRAQVSSDAWGVDQHNTVKASCSGTATLSS